MFDKLFGKKPPTQSQTVSGVTVNGGQVQVGQAGRDLTQNQSGQIANQPQGLTGAEVLALLERLHSLGFDQTLGVLAPLSFLVARFYPAMPARRLCLPV